MRVKGEKVVQGVKASRNRWGHATASVTAVEHHLNSEQRLPNLTGSHIQTYRHACSTPRASPQAGAVGAQPGGPHGDIPQVAAQGRLSHRVPSPGEDSGAVAGLVLASSQQVPGWAAAKGRRRHRVRAPGGCAVLAGTAGGLAAGGVESACVQCWGKGHAVPVSVPCQREGARGFRGLLSLGSLPIESVHPVGVHYGLLEIATGGVTRNSISLHPSHAVAERNTVCHTAKRVCMWGQWVRGHTVPACTRGGGEGTKY